MPDWFRPFLMLLVFLGYAIAGVRATSRANDFLYDKQTFIWSNALTRPELYRPEGQHLRRRAQWTWGIGLAIVVATAWVLSLWNPS